MPVVHCVVVVLWIAGFGTTTKRFDSCGSIVSAEFVWDTKAPKYIAECGVVNI